MVCALDDRPAVAFPGGHGVDGDAGRVYLRELFVPAGRDGQHRTGRLFAPKPLAMSAANDWTLEIEKKGLPELKALYKTLGADGKVAARCWPEFGHQL